jgi:hypothetical protein
MSARVFEVADNFETNELFSRNGWTDGPPPTPWLRPVECPATRR